MNTFYCLPMIAILVIAPGFAQDTTSVKEKCRRIIVPAVELEQTPFQDAILFLQEKSRELDEIEPDIKRKGVNIILLREIQRIHQTNDANGITMTAENMSLAALLSYAAQLGGAVVDIHPEAVVIGTAEEIQELRRAMGFEDSSKMQSTDGITANPKTNQAEHTDR